MHTTNYLLASLIFTLPPLALQLPEHCMHACDVTSVTHSRQTRKIQTLIVLPIRSGNKGNPGKF
ncbi:hypothetical protein RCV45_17705, partial [Escherichia coli]|nr:hypothetical protein [Escherichia coli]